MTWVLAFAAWTALVGGVYLLLSRDVLRCVVGLSLLGSAVNLLLFGAGRLGGGAPAVVPAILPAIVPPGGTALAAGAANPVPQALVLTAIVIGLALTAFSLLLVMQLVRRAEADDALDLRLAEPVPDHPVKPPL